MRGILIEEEKNKTCASRLCSGKNSGGLCLITDLLNERPYSRWNHSRHKWPHSDRRQQGMNKIRHSLLNGGKFNIQSWYSEYSLRAMPISVRGFSYTKIPDAIFFRRLEGGSQQKYFIEYERSLKNRERYRNILKFYANRKDVSRGSVLFICQNKYIQNELLKIRKEVFSKGIFNDVEEIFQFINYEECNPACAGMTSNCGSIRPGLT